MKYYTVEIGGEEVPFTGTIEFDGYPFGDTLLEDVRFLADVESGILDIHTVRIHPEDEDYFKDLNTKKWLREAVAHTKDPCFLHSEFGVYKTHMNLGDFVVWPVES
tara:strand:+ start:3337 stop:3654 length:318 start_codon:yes stop_codon:yes gene_type:complete